MNRKDEESPRVRASPNPPPLPVAFTSSRQESTVVARKLAVRKNCCTPTATKNTWDCLFDEGYRADVSINTDNGGIIYAHASILVCSLHNCADNNNRKHFPWIIFYPEIWWSFKEEDNGIANGVLVVHLSIKDNNV